MQKPSRSMPPPRTPSRFGLVVLWFGLGCAGVAFYSFASLKSVFAVACMIAVSSVFSIHSSRKQRLHFVSIALSREGNSICQFARSFENRKVDTWVIRAVYEVLQQQLNHMAPAFPVKATDRLEDLLFDSDDLDMAVAPEISRRSRRSLENTESNPLYGKVQSVADLVMFFNHQPKIHAA